MIPKETRASEGWGVSLVLGLSWALTWLIFTGCTARPAPASVAQTRIDPVSAEAASVEAVRTEQDEGRCNERCPVSVQVLGSGGPIADAARASTAYLVWIEGRSRLLIDAGGGAFLRFAEAGASLEDLDAIALSHLHADHSVDLVALLKAAYFSQRERPLPLIGPSGNDDFPATDVFLRSLLDANSGAYRYLSGYLGGENGRFAVPVTVGDAKSETAQTLFEGERFKLHAIGVEHGHVPALGYRVEVGGRSLALAGDQGRDNPAFVALARGAQVLIMHHAVPEQVDPGLNALHATPSQIGKVAAEAGVEALVLSHHMQRALARSDESRQLIGEQYQGPLYFARDLDCYCVD